MENRKKRSVFANIIIFTILFICLYFAYNFYKQNNFNDFIRSERELYTSEFKRDENEKYSKNSSYKISSPEYNDAMFYQKIQVTKNKPYRVTCMVKTKDVQPEKNNSGVGAQISIEGTTIRSVAISGTTDWQKIELIFNSKNSEELNIGFRLGGYIGKAKGEAWFSDFTIEEGTSENSNTWKFACFIFQTTDVTIDGSNIKLQVTSEDITDITNTIKRFETSASVLSYGQMQAECDIYQIETPITTLSYDEEFGYYVDPENIESHIKQIIDGSDYDHIFAIIRLSDEQHNNDIEINDWIGLRFNGLLWDWIFKYQIA